MTDMPEKVPDQVLDGMTRNVYFALTRFGPLATGEKVMNHLRLGGVEIPDWLKELIKYPKENLTKDEGIAMLYFSIAHDLKKQKVNNEI